MGMGLTMHSKRKRNKYFSVFMITILLLMIFVPLNPFFVKPVSATWWDSDWDYYRTLTIDSAYIDSELTDFPILVSISDEIGDKCKANGEDIVFTLTDNSTVLNHEIEKWDDNEDRIVWVKIPTISSSVDTVILMYYGNTEASDSQNPSGVWDSDYLGVYHLGETSGSALDSTGNANHGTYVGSLPTRVTGNIGYAQYFDGSGDYITFPSGCWLTGDDFGTHEVYFEYDALADDTVMTQWNIDGTNRFYFRLDGTDKFFTHCDADGSTQWIITSDDSAVVDTWYHISLSMKLDDVKYKVDNLIVGSDDSCNMPSVDVGEMLTIRVGARHDNGFYIEGIFDEIRISGIARSEAWLNATSYTQHQTEGFLTWGTEQEYVPPNNPPIQSNEIPINSSIGIDLTPYLYVYCTDSDNDNLYATCWSNSSGEWVQFASNWTGFANGTTIRQTNENFSKYKTTYYWSVNLTDGIDWSNETYHFTTRMGWDIQPLAWLVRNVTGVTIFKLLMSGGIDVVGKSRINGSLFSGNTNTGNFLHISETGVLSLFGNARVNQHIRVTAPSWKKGVTAPTDTQIGIFPVYSFDKSSDDIAYYSLIVPYKIETSSKITVSVDWCYIGANDVGTVHWKLTYINVATGELVDGVTTDIEQTSTGNHVSGNLIRTYLAGNIEGAIAHDILGLRLMRDTSEDTLDTDAHMIQVHFHFIQDKLGEPTGS